MMGLRLELLSQVCMFLQMLSKGSNITCMAYEPFHAIGVRRAKFAWKPGSTKDNFQSGGTVHPSENATSELVTFLDLRSLIRLRPSTMAARA